MRFARPSAPIPYTQSTKTEACPLVHDTHHGKTTAGMCSYLILYPYLSPASAFFIPLPTPTLSASVAFPTHTTGLNKTANTRRPAKHVYCVWRVWLRVTLKKKIPLRQNSNINNNIVFLGTQGGGQSKTRRQTGCTGASRVNISLCCHMRGWTHKAAKVNTSPGAHVTGMLSFHLHQRDASDIMSGVLQH